MYSRNRLRGVELLITANEQKHKFILDTLAMSLTALNLYEANDKGTALHKTTQADLLQHQF